MGSKLDNVRVVTFKEDYKSKIGKVLFKKGRTVAMHVRSINKLILRGAKADVKPFDYKAAVAKAKRERAIAEEKQIKTMYAR